MAKNEYKPDEEWMNAPLGAPEGQISQQSASKGDVSNQTLNRMTIPKIYRGVFLKAPKSRAAAVHANCLACCCFQREEIRNCIPECPLYPWRPYKNKSEK